LLVDATNGEEFAHTMMQLSDLPRVAREAHLDMMTASAYFFANVSAWLGTRGAFRNALLEKWLPGADLLAAHLTSRDPVSLIASERILQRAVQRLGALKTLAKEYGAEFVYLVPPTRYTLDVSPAVAATARPAHVAVLIPFKPGEMPDKAFSDGFHPNAEGAALYTQRAAALLQRELATIPPPVLRPVLSRP
jgi:hypothetical protein